MKYLLLIFVGWMIFGVEAISQKSKSEHADSTWIVETKDGNTYTGMLKVLQTGVLYEITTSIGVLTLREENISFIKKVEANRIHGNDYWPDNPHSSRYFFAPSGYGLRKGEGYYTNAWIFFNQLSYGFTNWLTLGAGCVPTFLFGAREFIPYWVTPKLNFDLKNGKGAIGLGTIYLNVTGLDEGSNGVGLVYGSYTLGSREKQLTFGAGLGYSGGSFSSTPAFSLSGLRRTSKKWALMTENYFVFNGSDGFFLMSGGARYMARRLAIDFGGFIPGGSSVGAIIILPWLSLNVPFGRRY
ncbi:MAG: hypothetical protein K1X68_00480 [Saprospiraceae bacterium]|nr:hypothetical protein [Saprospiraceae bacterium]HMW39551.1 hypothetical protein [Saprospiraceae bacterium]HMX88484.1 hypothetical protein [Saprospiraceae bacterium]HMZ40502.1 hypothetical protein [Saprospiraceae bacterium]HNA65659.1 hypothetical protein [Saprospiraceae bacterium]